MEARRNRGDSADCRARGGRSRLAQDRELAQRRRRHLEQQDHSRLQQALSRHQGRIRALGAEGIQRRAQRASRRRHRRRPDHLPAVRRARSTFTTSTSSTASTTSRAWRISPTVAKSPGRPTTARRRSACRWRRSSTASSTTKTPSRRSAPRRPRRWRSSTHILDKLKKDGTYTPIVMGTADQWEAATMGFQNIGPDYWNGESRPRRR